MKDKVWFTTFTNSSISRELTRYPRLPPLEAGHRPPELQRRAVIESKYDSGVPLLDEERPKVFSGFYPETRIKSLPDYFKAAGYFIVSQKCFEVFRQFDLGSGGLYPVKILQGDESTCIEGDYYLLEFGCHKRAFRPEHSTGGFEIPMYWDPNGGRWALNLPPKDNQIAVSRCVALEGPDVWIDPTLLEPIFFSDRLVQALRAAKVTRTIRLCSCRVVDVE